MKTYGGIRGIDPLTLNLSTMYLFTPYISNVFIKGTSNTLFSAQIGSHAMNKYSGLFDALSFLEVQFYKLLHVTPLRGCDKTRSSQQYFRELCHNV
jgi:hypothetical protein